MKTFDEAFAIIWQKIQAKDPVYVTNVNSGVDYIDNKEFTRFIRCLAMQLVQDIAEIPVDEGLMFVMLCGRLHETVQIGILIGTEMEKPDGDSK